MNNWRRALMCFYLEQSALSSGQFELTGGGTTDFYIDGRRVTTHPGGLRIITAAMMEVIRAHSLFPSGTNLVAPVVSGIPVAVALAIELSVPFVMDRGKPKQHGLGQRFEGLFNDSELCLVVDDLITVGTTLGQTIDGLRQLGKSVTDVLVVVDREDGGSEFLQSRGVKLHALLTKTDLKTAWQGNHE